MPTLKYQMLGRLPGILGAERELIGYSEKILPMPGSPGIRVEVIIRTVTALRFGFAMRCIANLDRGPAPGRVYWQNCGHTLHSSPPPFLPCLHMHLPLGSRINRSR